MKLSHIGLALLGGALLARTLGRRSLKGKKVVLMGASRGLGLDLARVFLEKGCKVAICARDPDEVARAREMLGGKVRAGVCDASDEAQVTAFITDVGQPDVLVTNAATLQVGPLENMKRTDFEEALRHIFWTTYVPTMAVLPAMRLRRDGHIVHMSSFGGKIAVPHLLPYSTAKFALTGFSEGVRAEVAKDGVRVSTFAPGLLRTGSFNNVPFKGQKEKEFTWFTLGATTPVVAMDAMRAARKIVRAIEHGDSERTFSWVVRGIVIAKAIAPGLISTLLGLQNRVLPAPSIDMGATPGREVPKLSKWAKRAQQQGEPLLAPHNEQ